MQADFTVLAAAYAVGVALLALGYVAAGPVWVERHSIPLSGPGRTRRVSGFWGELFLFTACAAVFVTVRLFTDVSLIGDVVRPHAVVAAGVVIAVAAVVWLYSFAVVAGAKRDGKDAAYCARLRNAYTFYSIYSAILFAGGVLVLGLLVVEFAHDQQGFNVQAQQVRHSVEAAAQAAKAGGDAIEASRRALTFLEDALGEIAVSQNILQEQMNPVFVFAAVVFLVNILIVLSPIRSAFMQGAVDLTHILTAIAIGGIIVAGFVSYFASYSQIIQHTLAEMEAARPRAELGAWELSQRYNQMVVELNRSRNLLGFAQAIGGQGSGLAIFAAAIQFTLDRIPGRAERRAEA